MMKKLLLLTHILLCTFIFSQKFKIELNLEKGKEYVSTTDAIMNTNVEAMGQKQQILMHILTSMQSKVVQVSGEEIVLETRYKYYHLQMMLMNNYQMMSSEDQSENPLSKGFAAIIDQPFTITMSKFGEIKKVEGYDVILNNLLKSFPETQRDAVQKQLNNSFSEQAIKSSFAIASSHIPAKKEVSINDTWTKRVENTDPSLKVYDLTYTLQKVDDQYFYISSVGVGQSDKSATVENMGFKFNPDIATKSTATIKVDRKTGWVKDQNINLISEGSMMSEDMDMKIEVKNIADSNITDDPVITEAMKQRRIGVSPPPPMETKVK